jgi:hypothetical protein
MLYQDRSLLLHEFTLTKYEMIFQTWRNRVVWLESHIYLMILKIAQRIWRNERSRHWITITIWPTYVSSTRNWGQNWFFIFKFNKFSFFFPNYCLSIQFERHCEDHRLQHWFYKSVSRFWLSTAKRELYFSFYFQIERPIL